MKRLLFTIVAAVVMTGCASNPEQHAQTCATAQAAYAAYQAVIAASEKPSRDQIIAAAAAGAFLQASCGWTTPPTRARGPVADPNGVLILQPPK